MTISLSDYYCFIILYTEDKNHIVKQYVFSGTSKAVYLQQFVETNIHHRQGRAVTDIQHRFTILTRVIVFYRLCLWSQEREKFKYLY